MPTISASIITSPLRRKCTLCRCEIAPFDPYLSGFGFGEPRDPPSTIYLCMHCARHSNDERDRAAIAKHDEETPSPEGEQP